MYVKAFSIFVLLLLLSSCGFHLRGEIASLDHLNPIYIEADQPYSEFAQVLQQTIQSNGIRLATSPAQARVVLHILNTQFSQQIQQLSANTQVKIFLLTYTVNYELINRKGEVIYGPRSVTKVTNYAASDTQLLADSNVLHMQIRQMMREVINMLLNQLGSNSVRMAIAK